jgi:hypothetical protein
MRPRGGRTIEYRREIIAELDPLFAGAGEIAAVGPKSGARRR